MYFIKNDKSGCIDLASYSRIFDYRNLMYKDWRSMLEKELLVNPTFLCDLSAALLTSLYKNSYSHKDIFSKSLRCCEQIIEDLGYDSLDEVTFFEKVDGNPNGTHVALVAGCQDDEMIQRRAEKAGELCIKSRKNFEVVFSGLNPGSHNGERNAIPNESQEMKKHFINYLKRNSAEIPKIQNTQFEPASNNTISNIDNFFNTFIKNIRGKVNLYVVSSSFHLIRLAESIAKTINADKEYMVSINSINLVGAESRDHKFIHGDESGGVYLKLMMFDVFRSILVEYPKNLANSSSERN